MSGVLPRPEHHGALDAFKLLLKVCSHPEWLSRPRQKAVMRRLWRALRFSIFSIPAPHVEPELISLHFRAKAHEQGGVLSRSRVSAGSLGAML